MAVFQTSQIVYRYLIVALAINVYISPGSTVSERLENALQTVFGSVLEPLQSWTKFQHFYMHMSESGALGVLKFAGLCKVISYMLKRKNRARDAMERTEKKKKAKQ
tara:strand:+ start:853 stop:1170 length:318 start_codon:yes stop_codon:yes gene_type:complete